MNIGDKVTLAAIECAHVTAVLQSTGSVTAAAKILGMARSTLYDRISRYKLGRTWKPGVPSAAATEPAAAPPVPPAP